jgi:glucosamine 6-phosphate synthetase-like amidotransferase/phosphosugar isomerase protein
MCGIFGLVARRSAPWDNAAIRDALVELIRLSEPRGSEATGLALVVPDEVAVFKRPSAPSRVLAEPSFQRYLAAALPADGGGAHTVGERVFCPAGAPASL